MNSLKPGFHPNAIHPNDCVWMETGLDNTKRTDKGQRTAKQHLLKQVVDLDSATRHGQLQQLDQLTRDAV